MRSSAFKQLVRDSDHESHAKTFIYCPVPAVLAAAVPAPGGLVCRGREPCSGCSDTALSSPCPEPGCLGGVTALPGCRGITNL